MSDNLLHFTSEVSYPKDILDEYNLASFGKLMTSDFGEFRTTDACICFGNPDFYRDIAEAAAQFYHQGNFPLIIVSGSNAIKEGNYPESLAMRDILMNNSVPEEDILVEDNSTNTKENIIHTKQALNDSNIEVSSILGIGRKSSSFRFVSTFSHNWNYADFIFRGVPDFENVDHENWMYHSDAALYIWKEVEKIVKYAGKGDLCPEFASAVTSFCDRLKEANVKDKKLDKIVQKLNL